jgi:serine/threonine protein kinase
VTTHWPDAVVTAAPAALGSSLARLTEERRPDAILLQVNFANADSADAGLSLMVELLRLRPGAYCIVLGENGGESAAARALESGAKAYLPLAGISRERLLAAIGDAHRRRPAEALDERSGITGGEEFAIELPGYGIVREIATSNFSAVYLARSDRLRRNVVLKVLSRGTSERELEDAERFQREYEIISSVSHRAIVEIYDFGSLPGHLYLAMEYFPCGDLRDRLRNPMSVAESLYYLRAIAEALRVIHAFGILHRDLKPGNVMLREDNAPVLIDFGLARRSADDGSTTGVGKVLGSPYYISPEQARAQQVDARTDLYSLGVMFYEMLTGEKPYNGRTAMAIMKQHALAPVPRLPSHAAAQQFLLDRLMAKSVGERYASVDELMADLEPMIAGAG